MINSVLSNQKFATWYDFKHAMQDIYDFASVLPDPQNYRRVRLATAQYVEHRQKLQALSTLTDVQAWLNENCMALLYVPLVLLHSIKEPDYPLQLKFFNVQENPDIDFTYTNGMLDFIEETVAGPGWSGELIVKVDMATNFSKNPLLLGLASFGIYAIDSEFIRIGGESYFQVFFHMLKRDFNISDFQPKDWVDRSGLFGEGVDEFDDDNWEDDDEDDFMVQPTDWIKNSQTSVEMKNSPTVKRRQGHRVAIKTESTVVEIERWIKANNICPVEDFYYLGWWQGRDVFLFDDKNVAMLFKLTFGGQ